MKIKRTLAMILALVMVMTVLPAEALAANSFDDMVGVSNEGYVTTDTSETENVRDGQMDTVQNPEEGNEVVHPSESDNVNLGDADISSVGIVSEKDSPAATADDTAVAAENTPVAADDTAATAGNTPVATDDTAAAEGTAATTENTSATTEGESASATGEVDLSEISGSTGVEITDSGLSDISEPEPVAEAEVLSAQVNGEYSHGRMYYRAELYGLTVEATVPSSRTPKGSYMTTNIVDAGAYAEAIESGNYGKLVNELYGLEIHFYNKKGKECKNINMSDITVTVQAALSDSYMIGRVNGNKVSNLAKAIEPVLSFSAKKTYTYVIAGLVDDGISRSVSNVKGSAKRTFKIENEEASISVAAPKGAFSGTVAMEVSEIASEEVKNAVETVLDEKSTVEIIGAYDISFHKADNGIELQPKKQVTVKIETSLDMSRNYSLVHVGDDGQANLVEKAIFTENGVSYSSSEFSIYAIVDNTETQEPARVTYQFFESDGTTPYVFKNKVGEEVDNQILKDGEVLEDVGLPNGSNKNSKFLGWYDEERNLVLTNEAKTVTETKTVKLTATFETVYNVMFMTAADSNGSRSVVKVKQVSYITGQTDEVTVDTSDVTTEAPDNTKAFIGWNTDSNASQALESPLPVSNDTTLYPVFAQASWLYFDENDGGSGGGASYTSPQYVLSGEKPIKPADPHRAGYHFEGWYKEPECINAFDFNQSLTQTTTVYARWTGDIASYTIVIYKQRVTDSVDATDSEKTYDYEVSIPTEGNIGDSVSIPTDYTGYDGNESVIIGETKSNFIGFHYNGAKTNADNSGKKIASDGSTVVAIYYDRNVITINFDYPASSSSSQTVTFYEPAEGGQYYYYNDPYDTGYYEGGTGPTPNAKLTHHRGLLFEWSTWQFFGLPRHTHYHYNTKTGYYKVGQGPDPNASGTYNLVTQKVSGTEYPEDESWKGLFGSSFIDTGYTWPSTYEVKYYQNGSIASTNTVNTLWEEVVEENYDSTVLVFLDAFILPDPSQTVYNLRPHTTGNVPVRFYQQNVDGTWPTDAEEASYTVTTSGGNFMITDKYTGFRARQYRTYRNGAWSNWTTLSTTPNNEGVYATVPQGYGLLEIRFERNSYDLEFRNGIKGAHGNVEKTQSIKYQAEIASIAQPPEVAYPIVADAEHYEFLGWFTDPEFTTYVSFTELTEEEKDRIKADTGATYVITYSKMPANNLVLYAGWNLKGYDCALNPNGGKLREGENCQAGVFWLQYGSTISDSIKSDTTREGYELVGWMVSEVNGELLNVDRDPSRGNLRFVGDFSNWTMTDIPWNFDTEISGPVYLTAKWRLVSAMSIVYDAKEGDGAPVDRSKYMDGSASVVLGAPTTLPENKLFKGWHIVGSPDSEIYSPGYTFTVNSENAVNNVITLEAIYTDVNNQDVNISHITWYANGGKAADGTIEYTTNNVQINKKVDIRSANTFTREGYVFLGWARVPATDDSGNPLDGYELSPRELTESDLFLKYDRADNTYKAQINGDWIEVNGIGADENYPYHDLYAVWELDEFYVWHSSSNETETFKLSENPTFNIVTNVKSGYIYGGYYGKSGKTYSSIYAGGDGFWDMADAYTESGLGFKPESGKTYYLKEVKNTYLLPSEFDTFHTYSKGIFGVYILTTIDDMNYKDVRFQIGSEETSVKNDIYDKVEVNYAGPITPEDDVHELTTQSIGGNEKGHIALYALGDPKEKTNSTLNLRMSVITPDNVQVRGVKMRRMKIGAVSEVEESDADGNMVTRDAVLMDDVKVADYTLGRLNTAYTGGTADSDGPLTIKSMPSIRND